MLFAALLLIKWVTLTIEATDPPFPRKEIHLEIPVEPHSTREFRGISPQIFRDSNEPTVVGFRHPTKIPFAPEDFKDTRSSLNPLVGNIGTKAHPAKEVMNSMAVSHSSHSGRRIPIPTDMNRSSLDRLKDVSNIAHILPLEGLRELQPESREENDTLLVDDHDRHYIESMNEKGDLIKNNNISNSLIRNIESSFNYEKKMYMQDESVQVSSSTVWNKINPDIIQVNDTNSNSFQAVKGKNNENFMSHEKNVTIENSSTITFPQEIETHFTKSSDMMKIIQDGIKSSNIDLTINLPQRITEHFNEKSNFSIIGTRKPKSRMHNDRKQKEFSVLSKSENSFDNKTANKTFNTISQDAMMQDGTFQASTTLFSENFRFRSDTDGIHNNDNSNSKSNTFIKSITMSITSSFTTPDSHMNDPPFRGPNIPLEIDHFYKEKERTKMDYPSPAIIQRPSFVKNFGEEWKPEKSAWGIAWDCHYYVFGSFFSIIAAYSFVSLLRVNTFVTLLHTGYYIVINSIILLLCLLRSFFLFYDPYNLSRKYPAVLASILPKITLPCLTSCFLLLLLSFLNSTKTQMLSPRLQRPSVLAFAIIFFISLFLCLEIAVSIFHAPSILIVAGQLILILWATVSSITYFCVYKKLLHKALRKQGEMIRLTFTKMHIDGAQLPKKLPKPTLGLAVKLVLFSAILQILLCVLTPFGMMIFHIMLPSLIRKDPWIWWGYQLSCRLLELLITGTVSFIATQPLKHFEIGDNRFCSILMWFPCSSFAECFKRDEIVDFEAHSDNYANPQGFRNTGLNITANNRRLQTNSLPTFRTPLTDVDKNLPMRTLPCSGRHTNHASAVSLLSYYRSKRTLSISTNDGLEELERTLCNETTLSSDGRNNSLRPASMLYKDNGFIRFRRENDPEQPMEMSDEDDHIQDDADTSLEDGESMKANVGSSFPSLLEGDVVQNTLSPFFQIGYKRRFRKMSRVSIETTDYSADVSSDQLSNVVNLRSGLSTSALDFNTRKYGSTCSSESAANSFDVTFFLTSNSSPEMQTSPTSTTPASLNVCSAYRSETEDDKTSSVEGHEVMLRSVSPIVKRASSGRLSLNLNLHTATDTSHSSGHVNVACGTEDITPDSAVYLDLHLSRDNSISPQIPSRIFPSTLGLLPRSSKSDSFTKSTDGIVPISPETQSTQHSPSVSPTSQSLGELQTSNSYVVIPRIKKNSRGLLYKLRGSTFSLNAAIYGYEPLERVEDSQNSFGQSRKRLERSSSDKRPLSDGQLEVHPEMTPLGSFGNRTTGTGSGFLGDSGLLGDCGVALVDVASQTEETDIPDGAHKSCTLLMKNSSISDFQTQLSTRLVDIRK